MKYIDADKLLAKIKELNLVTKTYEEQVVFNNALAMVVEAIDSLQEQPEVDLENYISNKLRELGADLINHKPYSFNRGLNVGKANAYNDILDRLNARRKE